ncbi:DUF1343 domain-containing protein [bacterium]|nr:DUF1343 domain-containing protein [bacterium]
MSGVKAIACGADRLFAERSLHGRLRGKRVGVLVNQTAVTADYEFWPRALAARTGARLAVVFSPEHGLYAEKQDQAPCDSDPAGRFGAPVVSLYGQASESLRPAPALLAGLEAVLFDIQDIGSRYYTFSYSLAYLMEAAAEAGVEVIVLDRPNPLGGELIEGPPLEPGYESFVGRFAGLPVRHGLSVGELALWFHAAHGVGARPTVIRATGWSRALDAFEYVAPWIMPSPNMPTPATALVYPGMCLLEGTNLSEGRGTTRPFEIFGAPYLEEFALADSLNGLGLPGVRFRPQRFIPTFDKHRGELCSGAQLHVTDRAAFRPFLTGAAVVHTAKRLAPEGFAWRAGAYEFVAHIPAIDILSGSGRLRSLVEAGAAFDEVAAACGGPQEETTFREARRDCLLYS